MISLEHNIPFQLRSTLLHSLSKKSALIKATTKKGIEVSIFNPWLTLGGGEKYIKLQMPFTFLPPYTIILKVQIM